MIVLTLGSHISPVAHIDFVASIMDESIGTEFPLRTIACKVLSLVPDINAWLTIILACKIQISSKEGLHCDSILPALTFVMQIHAPLEIFVFSDENDELSISQIFLVFFFRPIEMLD